MTLLAILGLGASPLRAVLPHALMGRGFDAEQVYDFNDVDHVNLFNGNLVVTIPIGQRYPLNAGFAYGFTLVYNSHIWDYLYDCPDNGKDAFGEGKELILIDPSAVPEHCVRGIPNPKSNAGTSWRLTLGELYDVLSPLSASAGWVFVGPDGAEHRFIPPDGVNLDAYPQYTRDGSHLRLRQTDAAATPACSAVVDTCIAIDLPDGTVYAFESASGPAGWRLRRIQDPFGNWVEVAYSPGQWVVTDSVDRSHTFTFDATGTLTSATLAAFGDQTATYTFATEESPPLTPGCPHDYDGASGGEILTYLKAVTLPDGSRYGFSYFDDDGYDGFCSHYVGHLRSIELPTGGKIAYEYAGYPFPSVSCVQVPIKDGGALHFYVTEWGIASRTVTGIDGSVAAEVHYESGGLSAAPRRQRFIAGEGADAHEVCIIPRTTFTDVYEKADQGRYKLTRNFFSIAASPPGGGVTDPWEPGEGHRYGVPVDHLTPDSRRSSRYRSSMVFDCPAFPATTASYGPNCALATDPGCWPNEAEHLRVPTSCYDANGDGDSNDRFLAPEQVHGLRDLYLEHESGTSYYTGSDGVANPEFRGRDWRIQSDLTQYHDAPGQFFVETDRADFDGYSHYRTTTTRSNSPGSVDHEVHVSYRPEVAPQRWLLGLSDGMTVSENGHTSQESYTFDRTTGFLAAKTTQRAGGNLVAAFTPDAFGNVETETYSGGDPGQPAYAVENVYAHGTLSLSQYVRSGRTILRTVDADIDENTGLPEASRDESGLQTAYDFDPQGRLTRVTPQGTLGEAATVYTYTEANPARTQEDKRASVTIDRGDTHSQIFFDGLGRPNEEQTTLPDGTPTGMVNRRFTTFTPQGQPDTVTTLHPSTQPGTARMTRMDYDVFGRPTRIRNPDDGLASTGVSQTFMTYDGIFKTVRWIKDVETPEGAQKLLTKYLYDHQGRLLSVEETDSEGANTDLKLRTRYLYDEGGRLVQVNQGAGSQIRTFAYDAAGLLTQECHPELGGGCIQYSGFDALGNATHRRYSKAGGAPFELDYRFDGAGRLTQVRSAQGPGQRLLKEFFYKNLYDSVDPPSPTAGNGKLYQTKRHNLVGPLDIVATVTHTYAGVGGRLSQRTVTTGGEGDVPRVRFTTDFSYDALGNLATLAYPTCLQAGCDGSVPGRQVTRTFTRGLLTGVGTFASPSRFAALSYHPNATVAQVLHGNGVRDVIAEDPSQLPRPGGIEVRTGATPGAGTLWDADYEYDGAGNVVSRTSQGFDGAGALLYNGTDLFRYDNAFNRLVSATVHYPAGAGGATESREYGYDPFGNLTSISGSHPRTLSPDPTTNRLASPFTYDDAGNLTSQPDFDALGDPKPTTAWYYDYDAFNSLVHARNKSGSIDRRFLYTADDERLAILTPGRELWTLRGSANSVLRDVEYLNTGWRWVEDYIQGATGLLATVESLGGGEKHYHLDHLGTPRLVTNLSQQVKARHVLAPYGEELTPTNQDELRMKFTGHERDAMDPFDGDGDLDYMHARFCSPRVGRFLSTDPVDSAIPAQPQSWNKYAYVLGNPLKYEDPDGESPTIVTAAIGAGIGAGAGVIGSLVSQAIRGGEINWRDVGASALGGAVSGGLAGATLGISLVVEAGTAGVVGVSALANSAGGAVTRAVDSSPETQAGDLKEVMIDLGTGAAGGVVGAKVEQAVSSSAPQIERQIAASRPGAMRGNYSAARSVQGHTAKLARTRTQAEVAATVAGAKTTNVVVPAARTKLEDEERRPPRR